MNTTEELQHLRDAGVDIFDQMQKMLEEGKEIPTIIIGALKDIEIEGPTLKRVYVAVTMEVHEQENALRKILMVCPLLKAYTVFMHCTTYMVPVDQSAGVETPDDAIARGAKPQDTMASFFVSADEITLLKMKSYEKQGDVIKWSDTVPEGKLGEGVFSGMAPEFYQNVLVSTKDFLPNAEE
jgi:hypothetical protein